MNVLLAVLRTSVPVVLCAVNAANVRAQVPEQVNQSELARQLLGVDAYHRGGVLAEIERIPTEHLKPELRTALITALQREGQLLEKHLRGEVRSVESGELTAMLGDLVATLRDPASISALAGAIGTSRAARAALAEFGERAAPSVLHVVATTGSISVENSALLTLRLMAEGKGGPLTVETRDRVTQIARERLSVRQVSDVTVRRAIDLAVALDVAELRRIVETLASDRNAVVALGVTEPDLIERTQRSAAEALARVSGRPGR
jgi:hypothetical protein